MSRFESAHNRELSIICRVIYWNYFKTSLKVVISFRTFEISGAIVFSRFRKYNKYSILIRIVDLKFGFG